jgi:hypothetical protein
MGLSTLPLRGQRCCGQFFCGPTTTPAQDAAPSEPLVATPVRQGRRRLPQMPSGNSPQVFRYAYVKCQRLASDRVFPRAFHHEPSGVDYQRFSKGSLWLNYSRPRDPYLQGSRKLEYFLGSGHRRQDCHIKAPAGRLPSKISRAASAA